MNKVVIVQARMTSSRLPKKVLLPLGNKTVLGQVLERCSKIQGINQVCCAIPEGIEHDILVPEIKKYGATVFRGSEQDVLKRYYEAAKNLNGDIIMRITSDCPLIEPSVCSEILSLHLSSAFDYTCNNMPVSWPHGYDCEVFNMEALKKAHNKAETSYEREHVTEWIRNKLTCQNLINKDGDLSHIRVTLDTPEDYKLLQNIFNVTEAELDYNFLKKYFRTV